jgi:hypothetical protein
MSDGLEILIDPEVEFVPYYSKMYLSVDTDALDDGIELSRIRPLTPFPPHCTDI